MKSVICEGRGQHQIIIFRVMNGESEEERNEKAVGIVMVKAIITKLGPTERGQNKFGID